MITESDRIAVVLDHDVWRGVVIGGVGAVKVLAEKTK